MTRAEQAYADQHTAALAMLRDLEEHLMDLPAIGTTRIDWGHVGSLTEVNSQLAQVLAFIKS